MRRRAWLATLAPALLMAACGARTPAGDGKTSTASAVAVAEQKQAAASLWPGFDPMSIPLAVYEGERTVLFGHPAPPEGFVPQEGAVPACSAYPGRFPAVTANTSSDIGGVKTATLILDDRDRGRARSAEDSAAIAIHEAFHVYQRKRHPGWQANEAALFVYPVDDVHLLTLRRLETQALRRALTATGETVAACFARVALERRAGRFAAMDPAFPAYERGTEMNEGLATHVEATAAGRATVDLPQQGFDPADVRRRACATGPAPALLLDRFDPGWPSTFEENDAQVLDAALDAALRRRASPDTGSCGFTDEEIAATEAAASRDMDGLRRRRSGRKAAFEARTGWRDPAQSSW